MPQLTMKMLKEEIDAIKADVNMLKAKLDSDAETKCALESETYARCTQTASDIQHEDLSNLTKSIDNLTALLTRYGEDNPIFAKTSLGKLSKYYSAYSNPLISND